MVDTYVHIDDSIMIHNTLALTLVSSTLCTSIRHAVDFTMILLL